MNQETRDRVIAKFKQRIAEMKQKPVELGMTHLDMVSPKPHLGELNNDGETLEHEVK